MPTVTRLKIHRYTSERVLDYALRNDKKEHWSTVFTVAGVDTALRRIKQAGYRNVYILRDKPVFAKNKFKWSIYIVRH